MCDYWKSRNLRKVDFPPKCTLFTYNASFRALSANAYKRNRFLGLFDLDFTKSANFEEIHDFDVKSPYLYCNTHILLNFKPFMKKCEMYEKVTF